MNGFWKVTWKLGGAWVSLNTESRTFDAPSAADAFFEEMAKRRPLILNLTFETDDGDELIRQYVRGSKA